MYGYAGKILRVNLTEGQLSEEEFTEELARGFLGGRGVGARLLLQELEPGVDPLGVKNKLVFVAGPITGTSIPGNTRFMIMTKSPLTGLFGQTNCSGSFGRQLKRAGYDAVVMEGKASEPVYLLIHDDEVEIRHATHLWGLPTAKTEDLIKDELHDNKLWVACIGPAGEKLVRFACVMSDAHRAAGRTGTGAVMGSKNLKAIAVRGTGTVSVADPGEVRRLARWVSTLARKDPAAQLLARYGTSGSVRPYQELGILPTKNYQEGVFAGYDQLSGETLARTILQGTTHCEGCPIPHDRLVEVKESPYGAINPRYGGAEYETVTALGSMCMVDDLVAVNKANEICNMYGVDTISAGLVIAWVMECYERGTMGSEDLNGMELRWGDAHAMLALLEKICRREGIGELLGEGVRRAAERIGRGSGQYAMHVRGLEIAMHEPRGKKGMYLIYTAANPRGGGHTEATSDTLFERDNAIPELGITKGLSRFSIAGKAEIVKKASELRTVIDAAGLCMLVLDPSLGKGDCTHLVEILNAVIGFDFTLSELMQIAERANNMARAFNVLQGSRRDDDILPVRFSQPLPVGASARETIDKQSMEYMLGEYYELCGWTADGVPSRGRLLELGLEWVAARLRPLQELSRG